MDPTKNSGDRRLHRSTRGVDPCDTRCVYPESCSADRRSRSTPVVWVAESAQGSYWSIRPLPDTASLLTKWLVTGIAYQKYLAPRQILT
jgi:hypothetical protein